MDFLNKKVLIPSTLLIGFGYYIFAYKIKNNNNFIENNKIDITNEDIIEMYNDEILLKKKRKESIKKDLELGDKKLKENQQTLDNNSNPTPFDIEKYEADRTILKKLYKKKEEQIKDLEDDIQKIDERKNEINERKNEINERKNEINEKKNEINEKN